MVIGTLLPTNGLPAGVSTQSARAHRFLRASGGWFGVDSSKSSENYGLPVGKLGDKGQAAPHGFDIALGVPINSS